MTTPSSPEDMATAFDEAAAEKRVQAERLMHRATEYENQAAAVKEQSKAVTKEAEGYEKYAAELRA